VYSILIATLIWHIRLDLSQDGGVTLADPPSIAVDPPPLAPLKWYYYTARTETIGPGSSENKFPYYFLINSRLNYDYDRIVLKCYAVLIGKQLYAFFWVILRCLEFICRRFGTLCLLHLHRQVSMKND